MVKYLEDTAVVDGIVLRRIVEGSTEYYIPDPIQYIRDASSYVPTELPVFYNPLMEINRDLTVLAVSAYRKIFADDKLDKITYVEALAGTGIRAARVLKETNSDIQVIANDIDQRAYKIILFNKKVFGFPEGSFMVTNRDATLLLLEISSRERADIVEIDPYGSPAPFLYPAIRAVKAHEGLLLITATDTAPLVGKYRESALRKYGTLLRKTPFAKEVAARALTYAIGKEATQLYRRVRPLFIIFMHHFIKFAGVVSKGKKRADEFWKGVGWLLIKRDNPLVFRISEFDLPLKRDDELLVGPLYISAIFDVEFLDAMLSELSSAPISQRNKKVLDKILRWEMELPDIPFFYDLSIVCSRLKLNTPPVDDVVERLKSRGFRACRTHFCYGGVKTDAGLEALEDVIRELNSAQES